MRVYVDATPLYNLGTVGETDLLGSLAGDLVIPGAVRDEVDVEPAATNLASLLETEPVETDPDVEAYVSQAADLLDDDPDTLDAAVIAGVLAERDAADETPVCGLLSDAAGCDGSRTASARRSRARSPSWFGRRWSTSTSPRDRPNACSSGWTATGW